MTTDFFDFRLDTCCQAPVQAAISDLPVRDSDNDKDCRTASGNGHSIQPRSVRVRCCQSKQYFPLCMCLSLWKSLGRSGFGQALCYKQKNMQSKDEEDDEEVENYTNDNPSRSRSHRCHKKPWLKTATHLPWVVSHERQAKEGIP